MKDLDIKEQDLSLISMLDYTQEIAVRLASENKGLIVKGNTNSGKRETVSNIISNSLSQGKRVLLVSKDTNALNNIHGRLKYINNKIMLLTNPNIDLDNFYNNISESLSNLSKNTGKTTLSKIKVLSRDIDKKTEMLNSINTLFYKSRSCGLNLFDMYKITEKKLNSSDTLYDYYKIYRIRKPFANYSYDDIKGCVEKLLNDNTIDNYVKYRRFKSNKLFSKLIKDITYSSINIATTKINSLLDNPASFELSLHDSIYLDDFISTFLINNELEFDYLKTLSQIVNLKHNSHILNKSSSLKKWNPLYWIKYKYLIKDEESKLIRFNNLENTIYSEFVDNLEDLQGYLKYFDFMKDILNKDEYHKFIKVLILNEDIVDYLTNLKNTLNIYESFKKITEDIGNFSDMENEVLTYCYNNIEKKEDIKKLISSIPSLYLFHNIEEIETSEKEVLYYYKNFEVILKEIQLSINTKISVIPSGIKYIWDNEVSNLLLSKDSNIVDYLNSNEPKLDIYNFLIMFKSIIFDMYPCFIVDYNNLKTTVPNIKGLFDIVVFYDGNNIYEDEIDLDRYIGSTHIIIGDQNKDTSTNCLLNIKSEGYVTSELNYNYKTINYSFEDDINFRSYLQKEIYDTFIRLGYKIRLNVKSSGYNLNIVFYSNNYEVPLLVLECDDIIYNDEYKSRLIDLSSRNYLESNGCNIIRVWSRDWWLNKKTEIKRIQRLIYELSLDI